eukprot:TRINITY_DN3605_c0_g1_i1.p1 TRINITY_DN3605_c0_g1~~TRINITY_DN3605_c0_g1_i1.p1  ORF type:complete len:199 (-),score=28.79 TRINITY_DN3605_c0_g1_i1:781-1377(-)
MATFSCSNSALFTEPPCCSKNDVVEDEVARFEVDTEPPTDDESDGEDFSFSRVPSDRTDASVEVHCGDGRCEVEELDALIHEKNRIAKGAPLWLAVDTDDHVQVVQAMMLVSPGVFKAASSGCDNNIRPKRLMPRRPPGVFLPPGSFAHPSAGSSTSASSSSQESLAPKRPPGVFFRPPPGLPKPGCAVTSLSGARSL